MSLSQRQLSNSSINNLTNHHEQRQRNFTTHPMYGKCASQVPRADRFRSP
jgi:hypothetical protein